MHKTINLKNDEIFRHAVKLNLNHNLSNDKFLRAESVRETICDLVVQGKLDAIDLKIIAARDCSPMPSMREVAILLRVDVSTVSRRLQHMKRLIIKDRPA